MVLQSRQSFSGVVQSIVPVLVGRGLRVREIVTGEGCGDGSGETMRGELDEGWVVIYLINKEWHG
jgi:hypothetical protein